MSFRKEGNIKAPVGEGPDLYLYGGSLLAAALLQPRSDGPTNTFWAWTVVCPNTCTQKTGNNELCPTITRYRQEIGQKWEMKQEIGQETGQETGQDREQDKKQDRTGYFLQCLTSGLTE